jgi:hypothetical protein
VGTVITLGAVVTTGVGVTTTTLPLVYPTHVGLAISISQTPIDTGVGLAAGNSKTSLLTTAVTASNPTNSVAPSISPSGSQVNTTAFTFSPGTWANNSGAVLSYQPTLNGAAFGSPQSGTSYTPGAQAVGTFGVILTETTTLGTLSVASSNTVTLTGSPAVTVTAPAFPATVQQNVAAPITPGTTTGSTDGTCLFRIYDSDGSGGLTTAYAIIGPVATGSGVYNPLDDTFFRNATGLTAAPGASAIAGTHVYVDQVPIVGGVPQYAFASPKSGVKVVAAASSVLVATVVIPIVNVTQGQAFSVTPVLASGGNGGPYTLAMNTTITGVTYINGVLSGTPTNSGSVTETVTLSDGTNTPVTVNFQFVAAVASVTVTPIAYVSPNQTFASMLSSSYVQQLGGQASLNSLSDANGISGSGTITGPSTVGTSTLRFGKIVDPTDASRKCFYFATKSTDPVTFGHLGRVEIGLGESGTAGAMNKTGTTYWAATEVYLPAVRWANGGDGTLLQVHQADGGGPNPNNPAAGPWLVGWDPGQLASPFPGVYVAKQVNATIGTAQPASTYLLFTNTGGSYGYNYVYPQDQWVTVVVKYRGDPTGTTGLLQIWFTVAGVTTQVVNQVNIQIGIATQSTYDYIKNGLDDLTGGGSGVWEARRAFALYLDQAGYTEPLVRANVTGL